MRQTVELSPEDWQRVLAVLATGPWQVVNPLIMAIADQLRAQPAPGPRPDGEDRAPAAKSN